MHQDSPEHIAHREEAASRLSREGRKFFKFIEFDRKEELITEIRKHPMGLFVILLLGGLIILLLTAIAVFVSRTDFNELFDASVNGYRSVFILVCFLLILGAAVMTLISAYLYISNVIFVTSQKIAQVLYLSIFNRKISQLSIGDVQDVTVTQRGILAHFFNYGTLVIETAGEQQNYTFSYVPNPYQVSQLIVGAHEDNLVEYGN